MVRVPYYDIEIYYDTEEQGLQNQKRDLHEALSKLNPLFTENASFKISTASRMDPTKKKWKNSFHIVVRDNVAFECGRQVPFPAVNTNSDGVSVFDTSVYKNADKRQLFRLPYTSKDGEAGSTLIPVDHELNVVDLSPEEYVLHIPSCVLGYPVTKCESTVDVYETRRKAKPTQLKPLLRRDKPVGGGKILPLGECKMCHLDHALIETVLERIEWRAKNECDWIEVMFCLTNIVDHVECRDELAHMFSELEPEKYDSYKVCERLVNMKRCDGFGVAWLHKEHKKVCEERGDKAYKYLHRLKTRCRRIAADCTCGVDHKDVYSVIRYMQTTSTFKEAEGRLHIASCLHHDLDTCGAEFVEHINKLSNDAMYKDFIPDVGLKWLRERLPAKSSTNYVKQAVIDTLDKMIKHQATLLQLANYEELAEPECRVIAQMSYDFQDNFTIYDMTNILRQQVFESRADAGQYLAANMHRVCVEILTPPAFVINKGNGEIDIVRSFTMPIVFVQSKDKKGKPKLEVRQVLSGNSKFVHSSVVVQHLKAYRTVTYDPSNKVGDDVVNAFRGFQAKIVPDDKYDSELCEPILNVLWEIWADKDADRYEYILQWYRCVFTKPEEKTGVMLILYGEQGTGKSILMDQFLIPLVFGTQNSCSVQGLEPLTQRFNSILMNKLFIAAHEASAGSSGNFMQASQKLKSQVTDTRMMVEKKGIDMLSDYPNHSNITITTNLENAVRIEHGDRRAVVLHTSAVHKNDFAYFDKLVAAFTQEVADTFFTFVSKLERTRNIRNLIDTEIKRVMADYSKSSPELYMQELTDNANIIFRVPREPLEYEWMERVRTGATGELWFVSSRVLFDAFVNWCETCKEKQVPESKFRRKLNERFGQYAKRVKNIRGYEFNITAKQLGF